MTPDQEGLSILGAATVGIITLVYKFIRMLKSDRNSDQVDNEEKEFRIMLGVELKELRESNQKLLLEKAELLAKISELTVRVEWLTNNCELCRNRQSGV
jgi:hypothetical protein